MKVFGIVICASLFSGCDPLPKTAESASTTEIPAISQTTMPLTTASLPDFDEIDPPDPEKTSEPPKDASEFLFSENDGGVTVYGYIGDETKVVIPEEIGGIPVTEIVLPLFCGNHFYPYDDEKDTIETLTIPKSVNEVIVPTTSLEWGQKCTDYIVADGNGFYTDRDGVLYSADLSTLVLYPKGKRTDQFRIPDPVETVGPHAFTGCDLLRALSVPSSVKVIDEWAFMHCTALEEILLADGLEIIGEGAFGGCSSLKTVSFPKTLKRLGVSAFGGCASLSEISLPSGITEVGLDPFHECDPEKITVYPAGEGLTVENDILKLGDTWIKMLPQSEIESVTVESSLWLNGCVFRNCTKLKEVAIMDGCTMKGIAGLDFYGCSSVQRIYIPDSVTYFYDFQELSASALTVYTQQDSPAEKTAKEQGFPVVYVDSYEEYRRVTETG